MTIRVVDFTDPEPEQGRPLGFTDETLAVQFAQEYEPTLRFVAAWSRWLIWDGRQWAADDTLLAFDLARKICRNAAARCKKGKLVAILGSAKTVAAVERLAKADRQLAATTTQWDADPATITTGD
jgi:putative DNA primase/helicase